MNDIIDQAAQEDIKTVLRAIKATGHLQHRVYNSTAQNGTPRYTDLEAALLLIFPLPAAPEGAEMTTSEVLDELIFQVSREK